ncbi:MAG: glycosyltransferase family 9 protein [Bacteroidales bacterium]|nr:glycosyltransferase family 9 protein [Bacteroidales bacterium]
MTVKFLILRFSSIGDIVLTTPVIRCLKEQVEGAEIHYAVKKQYHPLLEANPYIDRIHMLEGSLNSLILKLKEERYDYIIDLHKNLRTWIIKSRLRLLSFDFNKLNKEKWLMVNFRINRLPDIHLVDRYMDCVSEFDVHNDHKGLDYFIPGHEHVDIQTLPEAFHKGYIACVIGARHTTKKLPVEMISAFCNEINLPVILIGGPEDAENGEYISQRSFAYNACGKFSVNQSASIIKQARVIVTHDTGFMHIAAAFHKKIISVWGNTIPEFGMAPYMPHKDSKIFEVKGLKCRPCSKIGYDSCPKKHFKCMREINIRELATSVRTLFGFNDNPY